MESYGIWPWHSLSFQLLWISVNVSLGTGCWHELKFNRISQDSLSLQMKSCWQMTQNYLCITLKLRARRMWGSTRFTHQGCWLWASFLDARLIDGRDITKIWGNLSQAFCVQNNPVRLSKFMHKCKTQLFFLSHENADKSTDGLVVALLTPSISAL